MFEKQRIVVGVDGSQESLHAVRWAADRAKLSNWELEILCAYALPSYTAASLEGGQGVVNDDSIRESAQAVVNEAAEHIADRGLDVITTIEPGDPTGILVKKSKEVQMLVVGTRGGGGFADRLLGAVSASIPAYSYCPVAVIPVHKQDRDYLPVKSIVVGVDGSHPSTNSFTRAIEEAQAWNAELIAVEAVPMATSAGVLAWLPAAVDREAILEDVAAELKTTADELVADKGITVRTHAMDGNPAALLAEFSEAVDLVVVGTRGRGGFAGLLLGSTSQTVLEQADCPVLVIPTTFNKHQ